jgi:polysaccharide export outer membrane protein
MRLLLALMILVASWGGANAQSETLQRGDTISIQVFQDPKLDRQMAIGPTGNISFPLVGVVRAAGRTPDELANFLKSRLRDKYTAELDVTVSLTSLGRVDEETKPRVFITGEVRTPGAFPLQKETRTSIMQAIALAGGFTPFAAKQRIQIRRKMAGGDSIFLFDYAAFELGTNLQDNINLREGDVIIVPERGLFE